MTETTQSTTLGELAGRTHGPVHVPGTEDYDTERAGFQLHTPHRPAALVRAAGADDVRTAVQFAAAHDTRIAVQARGHGLATGMDDGVLISTRGMSEVRVDPRARTAWVQAGATWHQVIEAAAPHGLAPLSGSFTGVGAVSYTLGGGVGLLARRYGFAADHVRRLDVVTPDGQARHVTATDEPELFWALRGGGGNFGVVTGMEIALIPVSRIYGGSLYFDVQQVPEVLEGWRRWTEQVPEEMTSAVSMLPFPDLPAVPDSLRGRHVAQLQLCHAGPAAQGRELAQQLRAIGPCLRDTLDERPFAESGAVFDEPDQPHAYRARNVLLRGIEASDLATLPERAGPDAGVMCVVGIRHLGGALARPPHVDNAVGHRGAAYSLSVLSPVTPDSEDTVRAVHRHALEPWEAKTMGPSLNFSFGPLREHEVRAAFEESDYRRLTEIKARHDPRELVDCNHRIPPTVRPR